ncbi:MAG: Rne/Rng family ribonuclease [Pseudomonadota bacterium]
MPKTMLIDAYHREETRVAVLQGGKVEDFDFEYASRKPLRGNIYLARVTRVEPSLQAAFVEYGGNRHGFLAFGEIHPDYYQIPVADREVLRKAEALEVELAQKLAELSHDDDDSSIDPDEDELRAAADANNDVDADASDDAVEDDAADGKAKTDAAVDPAPSEGETDDASSSAEEEEEEEELSDEERRPAALDADSPDSETSDETIVTVFEPQAADDDEAEDEPAEDEAPTSVITMFYPETEERGPSEEELAARALQSEIDKLRARYDEAKRERNRLLRAYKIQEVIKRRQIMLVQVVKEERGNKGAALTTYLSLAGRYGVLMPNTARGGGISRKITSQGDRKRLKKAMKDFEIPANMGLIIRTAGAKRTKTEIRRDYDYLMRLWETIRDKTLESVAPSLIYEEASLMKRAIRDLYDKDTETIIVHGEEGHREAKDFMTMLMPSHAKHVKRHKSETPLFVQYKVDDQLDQMFKPTVQLKSGGYLVIQQTEALVSIDVNSGKATKERNVEQTALKTNSEAAVEVARQCRLRDLAGLIVIDFIDMEENRNNRTVEKKLKEAMKNDRARTQIGSISSFGLLEMSRQRRRSGIVDGTTQTCPVCDGAGVVRSHEMAALRILRATEAEATRGKHGLITVNASMEVALYILNTKRPWLTRLENLYGVKTNILADSGKFGDQYEVQGSGTPSEVVSLKDTVGDEGPLSELDAPELKQGDTESGSSAQRADSEDEGDDKPKRRRRRRRRRGRDDDSADASDETSANEAQSDEESDADADAGSDGDNEAAQAEGASDDEEPKRKRRRGRRGGRRNRRKGDEAESQNAEESAGDASDDASGASADPANDDSAVSQPDKDVVAAKVAADDAPASPPETTSDVVSLDAKREEQAAESGEPSPVESDDTDERPEAAASASSQPEPEPVQATETPADKTPKPRRGGWWQRTLNKL